MIHIIFTQLLLYECILYTFTRMYYVSSLDTYNILYIDIIWEFVT